MTDRNQRACEEGPRGKPSSMSGGWQNHVPGGERRRPSAGL
jgi:hypothetical protein